ncbi:MAG TPA: hypothetical protein VG389_05495 [Myxococcota bacterium]|jgi:hypothetical protein|nr:hypothetical protein [Myxococcota bacterium]
MIARARLGALTVAGLLLATAGPAARLMLCPMTGRGIACACPTERPAAPAVREMPRCACEVTESSPLPAGEPLAKSVAPAPAAAPVVAWLAAPAAAARGAESPGAGRDRGPPGGSGDLVVQLQSFRL